MFKLKPKNKNMNEKKILSAEEIIKPYEQKPFRHTVIIDRDNAIKAIKEYHQQFCRIPTDKEIVEFAESSGEMQNLSNYVPDNQSEGVLIDACILGAKFVRDNFISDAVEFAEWMLNQEGECQLRLVDNCWWYEDDEDGDCPLTTNELYQEFLNQKNKKG